MGRPRRGLFIGIPAVAVLLPVPAPAFAYHVVAKISAINRVSRYQPVPAIRAGNTASYSTIANKVRESEC